LYGWTLSTQMMYDLKKDVKMLDTGLLTAFSQRLFDYLEHNKFNDKSYKNKTILFGTDLLEKFASFSLNQKNYDSVESLSRHLQGNFSLVSGFWATIMFPLTNGPHFTLAVVKIISNQKEEPIKFIMNYYDSLGGKYNA
jgi:hypothetical protein